MYRRFRTGRNDSGLSGLGFIFHTPRIEVIFHASLNEPRAIFDTQYSSFNCSPGTLLQTNLSQANICRNTYNVPTGSSYENICSNSTTTLTKFNSVVLLGYSASAGADSCSALPPTSFTAYALGACLGSVEYTCSAKGQPMTTSYTGPDCAGSAESPVHYNSSQCKPVSIRLDIIGCWLRCWCCGRWYLLFLFCC